MAGRGNYAKGIAKQIEILTVALRLVAEKGYTNATLREIAEEVGLTKNGLLHHFGSKEELFAEVLRRRDDVDRARYVGATALDSLEYIADSVSHTAQAAGLVQLYARLSAEASDPAHAAHAYFTERYQSLRAELTESFERYRDAGWLREGLDPETCATLLIASLDGLQTQWLYDPSIDMSDYIRRFMSMLGAPDATVVRQSEDAASL
ncbi:MAG: TetR/AcrR family transcriptional regulator [Actinomyces sp.]|jgi:AcrR family transcriptional regulator|nr:TetR/AcrR family transcriptional regulator [Actinomyces sp.]MCI1641884.1 TetR/AcrR family transcriptional regulator [Actinomyces sp.]MCI1661897.1 TetR/AcrR family transcriptional regulator [Actinomyces sp.]MCI1691271.1 TetR/AcrR family transcriptional regulator [Actinomyces sp.]MCI1787700.1 TetR/AcrR family transcriptional regulator [Actinomyces sp.]MCI1830393.1 TetR/AcrR family transcriptional regulator [Actinomyces sp.]